MINSHQLEAFSDEWQKIAARRRNLEKGQFKRFLKGLGMVGAGTAAGVGVGHLLSRRLGKRILEGDMGAKAKLLRRAPILVGTLGAASAALAMSRSKELQRYVRGKSKQP